MRQFTSSAPHSVPRVLAGIQTVHVRLVDHRVVLAAEPARWPRPRQRQILRTCPRSRSGGPGCSPAACRRCAMYVAVRVRCGRTGRRLLVEPVNSLPAMPHCVTADPVIWGGGRGGYISVQLMGGARGGGGGESVGGGGGGGIKRRQPAPCRCPSPTDSTIAHVGSRSVPNFSRNPCRRCPRKHALWPSDDGLRPTRPVIRPSPSQLHTTCMPAVFHDAGRLPAVIVTGELAPHALLDNSWRWLHANPRPWPCVIGSFGSLWKSWRARDAMPCARSCRDAGPVGTSEVVGEIWSNRLAGDGDGCLDGRSVRGPVARTSIIWLKATSTGETRRRLPACKLRGHHDGRPTASTLAAGAGRAGAARYRPSRMNDGRLLRGGTASDRGPTCPRGPRPTMAMCAFLRLIGGLHPRNAASVGSRA